MKNNELLAIHTFQSNNVLGEMLYSTLCTGISKKGITFELK